MATSNDSSPTRNNGSVTVHNPEKYEHDPRSNDTEQKDVDTISSIDHAAEQRLVRKLDFFIIPPTMLLYLVSFLDRVNIVRIAFPRFQMAMLTRNHRAMHGYTIWKKI